MSNMTWSVVLRFARAFAAGAVSQMVVVISATPAHFENLGDVNAWITAIVIGGITGGLMALDKILRYVPDSTT